MTNAGAQLLQIYTGYIFRGPGLLREIVGCTVAAVYDRRLLAIRACCAV
jgi:dihydroorotate dehydrogenase